MTRMVITVTALAIATTIAQAQVNPDQLAKIRAATPSKATVQPAKARKMLVFTHCQGFYHKSIPVGAEMIRIMGESTGAYTATVTDDPAAFEADSLKQYDAICFVSPTGHFFRPDRKKWQAMSEDQKAEVLKREQRLKANLVEFVKGGGGIVGIHAATDAYYDWPEWGRIIGGYFNAHPWNEKVGVKLDEPDHPLNAAFKGKDFEIADEIYQFKAPYSRDKLRVLLSLDVDKTDMTKKNIRRTDGDFAVSWVQRYGKGRVFYCSLGHRNEIFWNQAVLQHYLDGIQYAMGDLKADDTVGGANGMTDNDGFVSLFNGEDLTGWSAKPDSWYVEDGAIAWKKGAGFIWSEKQYGDFVLDLEFKIAPRANSGIFIRTGSKRNWLHSGIEIQVLDSFGKENPGKHDCGAVYDCLAPSVNAVKKPGEWNHITITAKANKLQVVLNEQQIIDMDLNEWTEAHKNPDGSRNKFNTAYKDMPREGFIGFQDHGNPVWYRNVRLKVLD